MVHYDSCSVLEAPKVDADSARANLLGCCSKCPAQMICGPFHQAKGLMMPVLAVNMGRQLALSLSLSASPKQCSLSLSGHMQWPFLQQVVYIPTSNAAGAHLLSPCPQELTFSAVLLCRAWAHLSGGSMSRASLSMVQASTAPSRFIR